MIDYHKELNSEQLEVVLNGDGPCLVLAGAGSGKTRTITYRVAYLLEKGVSPEHILLVTFTNKAADEMIRRVQALTGSDSRLPWAGTFHHIANKILRVHAPLLGYQHNFTVLDSDDSESLVKLASKDYKAEGNKKFPSSGVLQGIISYARNAQTSLEDVLDARYSQWLPLAGTITSIATEYARRKKEANAMDFDDLLVNLLELLNDKTLCRHYAEQFQYILVDEYQDTNKIQASIIKKLGSVHSNVLVVGDDAQSIYSFRAADIQNILQFEKQYPKARVFKLETNYRSTEEILALANHVIANNTQQYQKRLKTQIKSGVKPALHPQMTQSAEAEFIVSKIIELANQGLAAHDIAVLFRAAHHSQMLEMELVKAGIPYDYRGGLRFFERAHIKDVLAYLRIISNVADVPAWMRVLMREEGIGPAAAGRVIEEIKTKEHIEEIMETGYSVLGEKAKVGWHNFVQIWEACLSGNRLPAATIDAILQSPYRDHLEVNYANAGDRLDDIRQLKVFAAKFRSLDAFLAEASLQESFAMNDEARGRNKVVLSTVHQAKGLEWPAVFVINVASGAFPNDRALREDNGIEEERRLFYVAITRAQKHLYLTYPMASGGWGESLVGPSMFLNEIKSDLIHDHSLLGHDSAPVLDDAVEDVQYIREDKPLNLKPGSFLRSIDDL